MAVPKRLRYEVLRRDNYTCRYCGGKAPDVQLQVDHVVPDVLGGTDEPSNLATACKDCNSGKSATPPDASLVAGIQGDALRWAQAREVAVQQHLADMTGLRPRIKRFDQAWLNWQDGNGKPLDRDDNWKASIERFMAEGLDDEFLIDAISTAAGTRKLRNNGTWRYFCGICWREIEKIEKRTAKIAAALAPPTVSDDEEPESEQMPLMEMFDILLDHLMDAMNAPPAVAKIANHALWSGMSEADKVYRGCSPHQPPPAEGQRFEAASDFYPDWIAHDMYDIGQILRGKGNT